MVQWQLYVTKYQYCKIKPSCSITGKTYCVALLIIAKRVSIKTYHYLLLFFGNGKSASRSSKASPLRLMRRTVLIACD